MFVNYVNVHYVLPLADYYTTGEGSHPLFWHNVFGVLVIITIVVWRGFHYYTVWLNYKKSRSDNHKSGNDTAVVALLLLSFLATPLVADAPVTPPKVSTSTGIYDIQSADEIYKFTAAEIRELVKMEDDRTRGNRAQPHPVLVYCFEERSFKYTGGKYNWIQFKR